MTARSIFFSALAVIMLAETAIMWALHFLDIKSPMAGAFVNTIALLIVAYPLLFKPYYRLIRQPNKTVLHDQEKQDLAAKIVDKVSEAIIVTDANHRIVRVNPAFSAITGYEPEEVIGRNPSILSSGRQGPEFYRNMWQSLLKENAWSGEIWNRRKNGEVYAEWLSIVADCDEDGELQGYIAIFSDITMKKKTEGMLEYKAHHDPLTELPNRSLFHDRLNQAVLMAARIKGRCALLFLDLDYFKEVNDTMGHDAGDKLLVQVASRLQAHARESDTIARLGGDEFAIILTQISDNFDTSKIAEKIVQALREPFVLDNGTASISVSVGIVVFPDDATDIELLMKLADKCMYQAKHAGRNGYVRHKNFAVG